MNGRVFVNRLAWNVEPLFPDMPAAAAISPEPFARCWNNPQPPPADAGSGFPYFPPLYNNSLPPTAYRMQPGCMPNLGQFWPPTPPPDGCGRYDSSNLYFGQQVLRHAENISSNIRSSFQGLGHYTHFVDTPNDTSQRVFKRETQVSPSVSAPSISMCSPVSKSESLKQCCVAEGKMKSSTSYSYSLPKQELHMASSGHEPYLCMTDLRTSSNLPSSEKSCFSPSYPLKSPLTYHSSSQERVTKPQQPENNSSPLKNVYFSHYESENINTDRQYHPSENKQLYGLPGIYHHSRRYHDFQNSSRISSPKTPSSDGIATIKERHRQKTHPYKVKAERSASQSDCKYQKSSSKTLAHFPNSNNTTSKPSDGYYSSPAYRTPDLRTSDLRTADLRTADLRTADLRTAVSSYYPGSCALGKPWQYPGLPILSSAESYFKTSEALKPPSLIGPIEEGPMSIAQTAPHDIEVMPPHQGTNHKTKVTSKMETMSSEDEDVMIIGEQKRHTPSSKHGSRHPEKSNHQPVVSATGPSEVKCEMKVEEISAPPTSRTEEVKSLPPLTIELPPTEIPRVSPSEPPLISPNFSSIYPNLRACHEPIDNEALPAKQKVITLNELSKSKRPELQEVSLDTAESEIKEKNFIKRDFNENHGLELLLNTIEKVAQLGNSESVNSSDMTVFSDSKVGTVSSNLPKVCGLDLLSAIAGERLASEFDVGKSDPDDSVKIESNYPEIKECKLSNDELSKQVSKHETKSQKSSVFEIHDRLVELQKKYKQKQKELSRLKPKKRLANTYLKGHQKICKSESNFSSSSSSSKSSTDSCSSSQPKENNLTSKDEKGQLSEKRKVCSSVKRKCISEEQCNKRATSRDRGKSKSNDLTLEKAKPAKKTTKTKRQKFNGTSEETYNAENIFQSRNESKSDQTSLPESKEKKRSYSLRHSSLQKEENLGNTRVVPSRRKSVNPKKYIASKQSKLSETIIAKQLRSRILFDTSGSLSDEENAKDGVPEDLYDALIKCYLNDENRLGCKKLRYLEPVVLTECTLAHPAPSMLRAEHLVLRHRLLALEDNLFYAGYIKEHQSTNKFGIALDGQRGNRLHNFTREELLTQTVAESKPLSSELPEGTRVCAYWSQQYRCLYPGFVGKAPCPSADWSEPRVFVLFDDGDSGQIPTKNVRLIPPNIIPSDYQERLNSQKTSSRSSSKSKGTRKLKSATQVPKDNDTPNEMETKESSCASVNESSCDDSCYIEEDSPSSSQSTPCSTDQSRSAKSHAEKRLKKRDSKRREATGETTKTKRRKKYKEKHHRHRHHHHRHHHHHHHHHHSKKRKHKRKEKDEQVSVAEPVCSTSSSENLPQDQFSS